MSWQGVDLKTSCDICGKNWTQEDIRNPKGIARLKVLDDPTTAWGGEVSRKWVIVGFGSGTGQLFVHAACLDLGKRVGTLPGYGDAN